MLRKILIVFFLVALLIFAFKGYFLKIFISRYARKELNAEVSIKKANFFLNGITVEGMDISSQDFIVKLRKGRIVFNFSQFLKVRISKIILEDAHLKASNRVYQFKKFTVLSPGESKAGLYTLKISGLKIKDKEIEEILISFVIDNDMFLFEKAETDFLGPSSFLNGVLDFRNRKRVCLKLAMIDVSFENIVNLLNSKEDVYFGGTFDGKLEICLKNARFCRIEGKFFNNKGGIINIKKEASLGLFRQYLDESLCETLVDNFRKYAYNKAEIAVSEKEGVIVVSMNFSSENMGKRNIIVNLYDVL